MFTSEAMPASDATGSRGAVTGDGRRRAGRTLGCESAIVLVESNTLSSGKCVIIGGVLYHVISPYKTTGRPSGKGPARLTHAQEMTHMRKLVISCHCITGLSNRIPPKLIFAGLIPRLAVL
jgi:hypothetical protein